MRAQNLSFRKQKRSALFSVKGKNYGLQPQFLSILNWLVTLPTWGFSWILLMKLPSVDIWTKAQARLICYARRPLSDWFFYWPMRNPHFVTFKYSAQNGMIWLAHREQEFTDAISALRSLLFCYLPSGNIHCNKNNGLPFSRLAFKSSYSKAKLDKIEYSKIYLVGIV